MPLPKAKDMRKMTDEELVKGIYDHNVELITLAETKYGRKQSLKKLIARMETVITERKRAKKTVKK